MGSESQVDRFVLTRVLSTIKIDLCCCSLRFSGFLWTKRPSFCDRDKTLRVLGAAGYPEVTVHGQVTGCTFRVTGERVSRDPVLRVAPMAVACNA
jgi:hypothetical protein